MAALSVRVSEDPARPLGHAIVTLHGLPRSLETFEFALSRHGFAANHLAPEGWQGAECWLQPEEAWYSGDALKFMVHPDLAFQLENMPYTLAVRGQGLTDATTVTFVWPLELELEEGSASGERRVVGGTRVDTAPKPRPEPEPGAMPAVEPPPPEIHSVDLPIPDVTIPEIGAEPMAADPGDASTQVVEPRVRGSHSTQDGPTRLVEGRVRPPDSSARPSVAEPTRKVSGRQVPPADGNGRSSVAPASPPPLPAPATNEAPPTVVAPSRQPVPPLEPWPVPAEAAASDEEQRRESSRLPVGLVLLVVLVVLAVLGGWWWFNQRVASPPIIAPPPSAPTGAYRAPEPRPAPEPKSAPVPVPAPEPKPAPAPAPAPEPKPAPEPAAPERAPVPPVVTTPTPISGPVTPAQPPTPERTPAPPAAAPASQASPKPPPAVPPARPGAGRDLEDELKSQFDPTLQELEKGLRRPKSSP